jgi:hypothetical protein
MFWKKTNSACTSTGDSIQCDSKVTSFPRNSDVTIAVKKFANVDRQIKLWTPFRTGVL